MGSTIRTGKSRNERLVVFPQLQEIRTAVANSLFAIGGSFEKILTLKSGSGVEGLSFAKRLSKLEDLIRNSPTCDGTCGRP